ncbi:MAG: peptidoglycan-binding protein, partial [Oscillospiraceae bacterium]|nr:peptidoglycan-binding protein [Oscillospiraceae bacterium]
PGDPVTSEKDDNLNLENHDWKPEMLKYGARGTDVYVLQSLLVAKKFFADNVTREIDGDFGAKTQAAVNRLQRFYGLDADGICGPDTWSKLLEMK